MPNPANLDDLAKRIEALEARKIASADLPWRQMTDRLSNELYLSNANLQPGSITPGLLAKSVPQPIRYASPAYGDVIAGQESEVTFTHGAGLTGPYLVVATLIDRWELDPVYYAPGVYLMTWSIRHKDTNYFTMAFKNGPYRVAFSLDCLIVPL